MCGASVTRFVSVAVAHGPPAGLTSINVFLQRSVILRVGGETLVVRAWSPSRGVSVVWVLLLPHPSDSFEMVILQAPGSCFFLAFLVDEGSAKLHGLDAAQSVGS